MSDHELMLAVHHGDLDRMSDLFDRYHRSLFNYFLEFTGKREVSEDLVQEVFYKMLKYRNTYRNQGNFKSWMYTIARNSKIDYYRKCKKHSVLDEINSETFADKENPLTNIEEKSNLFFLKKALFMLPEEKREVLVLSRFQELKYEEIGDILGYSVANIKVMVHRAVKELSKNFFLLTGEAKNEL
jgi:RNA polymerase sigma-70 factor (ECF subfamily)